jgi:hypothetical protein
MNTNVRIVLDEEQRRLYKEVFGESATRNNIKYRTAKMFFKAMGSTTPSKDALKSTGVKFAKTSIGQKKLREKNKRSRNNGS